MQAEPLSACCDALSVREVWLGRRRRRPRPPATAVAEPRRRRRRFAGEQRNVAAALAGPGCGAQRRQHRLASTPSARMWSPPSGGFVHHQRPPRRPLRRCRARPPPHRLGAFLRCPRLARLSSDPPLCERSFPVLRGVASPTLPFLLPQPALAHGGNAAFCSHAGREKLQRSATHRPAGRGGMLWW